MKYNSPSYTGKLGKKWKRYRLYLNVKLRNQRMTRANFNNDINTNQTQN